MARRIDALYCTRETASERIEGIIAETSRRATALRAEVGDAISERIEALQARQRELITQIDRMAQSKIKVLRRQLEAIVGGNCPIAPPEDPDQLPDPSLYKCDADAVICFRTDDSDFKDKIPTFGKLSEASTYSSHSYAKGPALGVLKVNNPSFMWIVACDRNGDRRLEGGDVCELEFSSPQDFDQIAVEDLKDGRYKVTFVPLASGNFQLMVYLACEGTREAIKGSPIQLHVRPKTDYSQIAQDADIDGKDKFGQGDQPTSPGGRAPVGTISRPSGINFDEMGRYVFVADQGNHRIQVFDINGLKAVTSFGKKGMGPENFNSPSDVICDTDGRVLVSDLLNHRIQILQWYPRTLELVYVQSFGTHGEGIGHFQFPKGMCLMENGHLLVTDSGTHRVQVFDSRAGFEFVREFGGLGTDEGLFNAPLSVAVNNLGETFVSDSTHRIQVFDSNGKFKRAFGQKGRKDGQFNFPINMVINDENALFVCDHANHRVQVFDAENGTFLHKWGGSKLKKDDEGEQAADEGDEAGNQFDWVGLRCPSAIAVNSSGSILVTDSNSSQIFVF